MRNVASNTSIEFYLILECYLCERGKEIRETRDALSKCVMIDRFRAHD